MTSVQKEYQYLPTIGFTSNKGKMTETIKNIPPEIIQQIIYFLDGDNLIPLRRTCQAFKEHIIWHINKRPSTSYFPLREGVDPFEHYRRSILFPNPEHGLSKSTPTEILLQRDVQVISHKDLLIVRSQTMITFIDSNTLEPVAMIRLPKEIFCVFETMIRFDHLMIRAENMNDQTAYYFWSLKTDEKGKFVVRFTNSVIEPDYPDIPDDQLVDTQVNLSALDIVTPWYIYYGTDNGYYLYDFRDKTKNPQWQHYLYNDTDILKDSDPRILQLHHFRLSSVNIHSNNFQEFGDLLVHFSRVLPDGVLHDDGTTPCTLAAYKLETGEKLFKREIKVYRFPYGMLQSRSVSLSFYEKKFALWNYYQRNIEFFDLEGKQIKTIPLVSDKEDEVIAYNENGIILHNEKKEWLKIYDHTRREIKVKTKDKAEERYEEFARLILLHYAWEDVQLLGKIHLITASFTLLPGIAVVATIYFKIQSQWIKIPLMVAGMAFSVYCSSWVLSYFALSTIARVYLYSTGIASLVFLAVPVIHIAFWCTVWVTSQLLKKYPNNHIIQRVYNCFYIEKLNQFYKEIIMTKEFLSRVDEHELNQEQITQLQRAGCYHVCPISAQAIRHPVFLGGIYYDNESVTYFKDLHGHLPHRAKTEEWTIDNDLEQKIAAALEVV